MQDYLSRFNFLVMIVFLLLNLALASCTCKVPISDDINELKRELNHAQNELSCAKTRVLRLEEAIAAKQIRRIEKQIARLEQDKMAKLLISREQRLDFFSDQRETLATIIHNYPLCATQAQKVLDQILTLITHISDEIND